jgi:hypothetical protein
LKTALNRAQTKGTTGATDGPQSLAARITLPVSCGQTGGCRRVDARFALAFWTLTFGPLAVETSVPSDACHPWLWSLSALVTVGTGWCEKPLNQPNDTTLDESAGSFMKMTGTEFDDACSVFMVVLSIWPRTRRLLFPNIDTALDQRPCDVNERFEKTLAQLHVK